MPRGMEAKAARAHNRACMRGRSTANASTSVYNQIKGKKYKKGESSSVCQYQAKLIIYENNQYLVNYRIAEPNVIEIGKIIKANKTCNMKQLMNSIITNKTLKDNIIKTFMIEIQIK